MPSYTLSAPTKVTTINTPGQPSIVHMEYNLLSANGGSVAVGDTISCAAVPVPPGCRRILCTKLSSASNADQFALQGFSPTGIAFDLPHIGQTSAGAAGCRTSMGGVSNIHLQAPAAAPLVFFGLVIATSVPGTLSVLLSFVLQ